MLEPKDTAVVESYIGVGLRLLADFERAAGTIGGQKAADNYARWANDCDAGKKISKRSLAFALRTLMLEIQSKPFCGDPRTDWTSVKRALSNSTNSSLSKIAGHLDYLVAFGRGQFLALGLLNCWDQSGDYTGARVAFDSALAQDSLIEASQDPRGVHVMTIHRSKGKQFDAVIILRKAIPSKEGQWRSSFIWRDDSVPYSRSRKILRVGITRARKQVLIVDPVFPSCPLLQGLV